MNGKELIARDGCWLTQKHLSNEWDRGFWKRLYLAVSITEDDFVEWTDGQKEQWKTEHPEDKRYEDEISDTEALNIIIGHSDE